MAWPWTTREIVSLRVPSVFGSIRISTIPILLAQRALLRLPRRTGTDHPLIFHGSRLSDLGRHRVWERFPGSA